VLVPTKTMAANASFRGATLDARDGMGGVGQ